MKCPLRIFLHLANEPVYVVLQSFLIFDLYIHDGCGNPFSAGGEDAAI